MRGHTLLLMRSLDLHCSSRKTKQHSTKQRRTDTADPTQKYWHITTTVNVNPTMKLLRFHNAWSHTSASALARFALSISKDRQCATKQRHTQTQQIPHKVTATTAHNVFRTNRQRSSLLKKHACPPIVIPTMKRCVFSMRFHILLTVRDLIPHDPSRKTDSTKPEKTHRHSRSKPQGYWHNGNQCDPHKQDNTNRTLRAAV
jgi:hypothetical protein